MSYMLVYGYPVYSSSIRLFKEKNYQMIDEMRQASPL